MEASAVSLRQLAATSRRFAQRLVTIGENRLALLTVEIQEARERLLHALLLLLGLAVFGLLASITLTGVIVVLLWSFSPVAALLVLTGVYGAAAAIFYRRLNRLMRDWQTIPASLDQLRKDRACLEKILT